MQKLIGDIFYMPYAIRDVVVNLYKKHSQLNLHILKRQDSSKIKSCILLISLVHVGLLIYFTGIYLDTNWCDRNILSIDNDIKISLERIWLWPADGNPSTSLCKITPFFVSCWFQFNYSYSLTSSDSGWNVGVVGGTFVCSYWLRCYFFFFDFLKLRNCLILFQSEEGLFHFAARVFLYSFMVSRIRVFGLSNSPWNHISHIAFQRCGHKWYVVS